MRTLLDTNVLTRSAQPHHALHRAAVDAVAALRRQGDELVVAPQLVPLIMVEAKHPAGE
jgi:hypothetical protein